MQRLVKALAMLLIVGMTMPGCSSFSKQARLERAHRKYVRKVRHEHQKETAKAVDEANRPLRDPAFVSPPTQTITLEPLPSENVAAPVVVSDNTPPTP